MSVREYIGARYVPLFADPLEWDNTREYEPLTIVMHQGNSYTSRQAVPVGVDISRTDMWALTGNYDAQIEQYRQEVSTFDGRITANSTAIYNTNQSLNLLQEEVAQHGQDIAAETSAREAADTALGTRIDAEATAREAADTALDTRLTGQIDALKDPTNPVYYGADPTGTSDSTAAIQAAVNANKGASVHFTPGKYLISAPIETPWPFAERVSLYGNGAVIFANSTVSAAFILGSIDNPGNNLQNHYSRGYNAFENFKIQGENITTGVVVSTWYMNARIANVNIQYCLNGIASYPEDTGTGASDTEITNCVIVGREENGGSATDSFGVKFGGTDNKVTNCRIYWFNKAIHAIGGGLFCMNVHWVGNWYSVYSHAGDDVITNCYFDSQRIGYYYAGSGDVICTIADCHFLNANGYDYTWIDLSNYGGVKLAPTIQNNVFGFSTPETNYGAKGLVLPDTTGIYEVATLFGIGNINGNIISAGLENVVRRYDPLLSYPANDNFQSTFSGSAITPNVWYKVGAVFMPQSHSVVVRYMIGTAMLEVEVNSGYTNALNPIVYQVINNFPNCSIGSKTTQVYGDLAYVELFIRVDEATTMGLFGVEIESAFTSIAKGYLYQNQLIGVPPTNDTPTNVTSYTRS